MRIEGQIERQCGEVHCEQGKTIKLNEWDIDNRHNGHIIIIIDKMLYNM